MLGFKSHVGESYFLRSHRWRIISDGAESNKKFRNKVPDKNILRVPFTCGIEVSREIANELIQKDGEYIIVALFHHYNYPIESVLELGNFFENEENVQFITLEEISKRIDSKCIAGKQISSKSCNFRSYSKTYEL